MSKYKIKSPESYFKAYRKSIRKPEKFWDKIAREHFEWDKTWDNVFEGDMSEARFNWFTNARLNITHNAIDRHLDKHGDKTAILFEPNNPDEPAQHISYRMLHERVCRLANVLRSQGIVKGDRICIYLPMIPELAISLLACARIGAIHSVVFGGFSAKALETRINDSGCKLVITADGGFRGSKTIDLKGIVDEALQHCPTVETVLVTKRIHSDVSLVEGRDRWLAPLLEAASDECPCESMDAEDPLFILYTSGSTGKPKGMLHTTAGYMVYTAYTFKNVFDYRDEDVYWCTADIGWITGHSYIVYGPLLNAATTVMFEGVPTYPDAGRFWAVIEKHSITQLYTAPTAIRSLAKENVSWVEKHDLSSLRVIGSVGEPINEEAWHWYNEHIGHKRCPLIDTWWQTETGGILISPLPFITPTKPTYATLPLPGIQPVLISENHQVIDGSHVVGSLCIRYPWPSIARTIWGDHQRYLETYFTAFKGHYFTGDGAMRDEVGYYRITGRMDDVIIVSGHNLGTAPIEDAINEHPKVAESAIVGFPHDIKGSALYGFVVLRETEPEGSHDAIRLEVNKIISDQIGPIAKLDKIQFVSGLPKTRSGKIMRRILRKIAKNDFSNFGDTTTLLNPEVVEEIRDGRV